MIIAFSGSNQGKPPNGGVGEGLPVCVCVCVLDNTPLKILWLQTHQFIDSAADADFYTQDYINPLTSCHGPG